MKYIKKFEATNYISNSLITFYNNNDIVKKSDNIVDLMNLEPGVTFVIRFIPKRFTSLQELQEYLKTEEIPDSFFHTYTQEYHQLVA